MKLQVNKFCLFLIFSCLMLTFITNVVASSINQLANEDVIFGNKTNIENELVQHSNFKYSKNKSNTDESRKLLKIKHQHLERKSKSYKNTECVSCKSESLSNRWQEEQERQRIEYIKEQILQKLGMNSAPKTDKLKINVNSYLQMLESSPMSSSLTENTPSLPEKKESTDKFFIFPLTDKTNYPTFNLSIEKSYSLPIKRIILAIKINTLLLHEVDQNEVAIVGQKFNENSFDGNSTMRVLGIVRPTESKELIATNWFQYDITSIAASQINKQLISIQSEAAKINKAFITVEYNHGNAQRTKRSVNCSPGNSTSCCRENFYVNFTQIGWDNWILQPTGYNANYCRGKCDISHARYHHTTVIGKFPSLISLCCSPREVSHISLIYVDDQGFIFSKNLPNMVVESCDCA